MNLLERAVCVGLKANASVNSTAITYRRGHKTVTIPDAQRAQKPHRVDTNEQFGLIQVPNDWLIRATRLKDLGLPLVGDIITDPAGVQHRVCEQLGEPHWRYHVGSGKQYLRIHSEVINETCRTV